MISLFRKDRRRYIRVAQEVDHPIGVHINGENFFDILTAKDISIGGLGIVAPHEFKGCRIDRLVSLVITLPYPIKKSFMAKGTIKHVVDERFGVMFVEIDKKSRDRVREYVSYRIQRETWWTKLKFKIRLI